MPNPEKGYAWKFVGKLTPEQREHALHLEEQSGEAIDWYIPSAASPPMALPPELEEALPISLLDGEFAEKVLRGEI
jgi:hypothetical protein